MALGVISDVDLQNAYDVREKLKQELADVLAHPLVYLGNLPGKVKNEYAAKWSRFQDLSKNTDLKSQFEAGEILGDVLMEIAMLIAGVVSGVGMAAKLASKVPELIKVSRVLKRAGGGRGHPGRGHLSRRSRRTGRKSRQGRAEGRAQAARTGARASSATQGSSHAASRGDQATGKIT
jgi:hypothetical protein